MRCYAQLEYVLASTCHQLLSRYLTASIGQQLDGNFDGSIGWYVTTVKLDLEARGVIERVPNVTPQQLRLVS